MNWSQRKLHQCDLFIGVCGYESRSRYALTQLETKPSKCLFLDYNCSSTLSYDENKSVMCKFGASRFIDLRNPIWIKEISDEIAEAITHCTNADVLIDVVLDVSSASRKVVSQILILIRAKFSGRIQLSCVYSVAEFYDPPTAELPSHISEPVVGALAGWSEDLSKPPCAIVGLGFEPGRAMGCLDYLEIPEARLFFPQGPDSRFASAVDKANSRLVSEVGEEFVLPYSVNDPHDTLVKLLSLVTGLEQKFRPIIIPFGPKIFAAIGVVVAIQRSPNICVWRASSGGLTEPHDSKPEGSVCCLSVNL